MATKVARGKALVAKLRAQKGVRDPEALAASLGRKKKARAAAKKAKSKGRQTGGNGFSAQENALFREVAGEDMPANPQRAREMLQKGDFEDADQDALIALDDKLIEAATPPSAVKQAGLDRQKHLGRFDSVYAASGWADQNAGAHIRSLPKEQRNALGYYKRGGYQSINSRLRETGGNLSAVPKGTRERIEPMDGAFKNAPSTDRAVMVMRRGLPPEVKRAFANHNEAGLLGQTFGDDGFASTTMNNDWLSQAVGGHGQLFLVLPKGSKALPIDGTANIKGAPEDELLLPRGSRYRITTVERGDKGDPIIEAELLLE